MQLKALFASSVVAAGILVVYGCSKDAETTARASLKGEACQVTNDCAGGLACIPLPGSSSGGSTVSVCTVAAFQIAATPKECALLDCTVAADCAPVCTPPSNCASLLSLCAADAGSSSVNACQLYDQTCKCDTSKFDCEQGKCINKCTSDIECTNTSIGRKCAGGKCVQCAGDSECATGQQCLSGKCQSPCQTDGDCAGFQRCAAGKCIAGGCQTDRECVAERQNVEATCGTNGQCIVPCQTDLECGNPKAYGFFSCIQNQCIDVGCQSDKDCRLRYTGPNDASTLLPKQHVVCRDKTTPGNVTRPAQ